MARTVQPFNVITARTIGTNAAQFIQDKKIEISRTRITQFQYGERWPEEYISYSGPVGRNPFKKPETFFRVMAARPEKYAQRFTFLPATPEAVRQIKEAAEMAWDITTKQAWKYGVDTGLYGRSFMMYRRDKSGRSKISSFSELDNATEDTVFQMTNAVSYASTAEVNALYYSKIGGVLYYAAQKIKRAFPQLGVRFVYEKSEAFGFGHVYDAPVLSIGSRKTVRDQLKRPGKNYRKAKRLGRSRRRR